MKTYRYEIELINVYIGFYREIDYWVSKNNYTIESPTKLSKADIHQKLVEDVFEFTEVAVNNRDPEDFIDESTDIEIDFIYKLYIDRK